jgi:hypothetical protein
MDSLLEELQIYSNTLSVQTTNEIERIHYLCMALQWVYIRPLEEIRQIGPIILLPLYLIITQSSFPSCIKEKARQVGIPLVQYFTPEMLVSHVPLSVSVYQHLSMPKLRLLEREQTYRQSHILLDHLLSPWIDIKITDSIPSMVYKRPTTLVSAFNALATMYHRSYVQRTKGILDTREFDQTLQDVISFPLLSFKDIKTIDQTNDYYYTFFIQTHIILWLSDYGASPIDSKYHSIIVKVLDYIYYEIKFLLSLYQEYIEYICQGLWCLQICIYPSYPIVAELTSSVLSFIYTLQNRDGSIHTSKSKQVSAMYDKLHPTLCSITLLIPRFYKHTKSKY